MRNLLLTGCLTLSLVACTPNVSVRPPAVNVPININGNSGKTDSQQAPAQTQTPATTPAPTTTTPASNTQSSAATTSSQPTTTVQASNVQAGSAGSLDTSVKVLPGNSFPFEDGLENFSLGQVTAVAAPQNYGIFRTDGVDDPNFAKIEETFDAEGAAGKALQINNTNGYIFQETTGVITFGANDSKNYTASFDFKTPGESIISLRLNISNGGGNYYQVNVHNTKGWVTMTKVLGNQAVQVVNRDGLGVDYSDNLYHKAEIINQDGNIKVLINGRTLVDYTDADPNYHQGGFGIGVSSTKQPLFVDNIRVNPL